MPTSRRFTCADGSSNKFWEITVEGLGFVTRYGKIGSSGQSTRKDFGSAAEAEKEAAKLVAEKMRKGYVESGAGDASATAATVAKTMVAKDDGANLVDVSGADLVAALITHFSYLVDTPGYKPVLDAVFSKATKARMDGDDLVVQFGAEDILTAKPPGKRPKGFPKEFAALCERHAHLSYPDADGWALVLGDHGGFETSFLEDTELAEVASKVTSPIQDYSDWFIYNPTEKNSRGEPAVCAFSHEGGGPEGADDAGAGAIFLRRMAEIMELEVKPDQVATAGGAPRLSELAGKLDEGALDIESDDASIHAWIGRTRLLRVVKEHLSAWDVADPAQPKLLGRCKLSRPITNPYGTTLLQLLADGRAFIADKEGYWLFDVSDLAAMRELSHVGGDHHRASNALLDGTVLCSYYIRFCTKGIEPRDGLYHHGLDGHAQVTQVDPEVDGVQDQLVVGGRAYFVTKDVVAAYELNKGEVRRVASLRSSGNSRRCHDLSDRGQILVFEMFDNRFPAVMAIDIRNPKPKITTKLWKGRQVRSIGRDGDELFFVLSSEWDRNHYFARARIGDGEIVEVLAPVKIPQIKPKPILPMLMDEHLFGVVLMDGVILGIDRP